MRRVLESRSLYIVVVLLRQLTLLVAGACPGFPEGSFEPVAAHEAIGSCLKPGSIQAAQQPIGRFTISDLSALPSASAKCEKGEGELKAVFDEPKADVLQIGNAGAASCSLVHLVAQRSDSDDKTTVQLRLDFDSCTAGPHASVVILNIVPVPDVSAPTSMLPFWRQICTKQTVTAAPNIAHVSLALSEQPLGNNTCDANVLASYPQLTKLTCKELCISEITKYSRSNNSLKNPDICSAYSFNPTITGDSDNCILYKGDVKVKDISEGEQGAACYGLQANATHQHVSTPPPPTAEELAAQMATLPKLNATILAAQAAVQTFVSPDKCFQPFSWITLQDVNRATVSVPMPQSHWDEFLELIPVAVSERRLQSSELISQVFADRALFGTAPTTVAPPIGAAAPQCVQKTEPGDWTNVYVMGMLAMIALCVGCCMARGLPQGSVGMPMPQGKSSAVAPQPMTPTGQQNGPPPQAALGNAAYNQQQPSGPYQSPPSVTSGPSSGGPSMGPGGPSGGPGSQMSGSSGPSGMGPSGPSMGPSGPSGGPSGGRPGPAMGPSGGGPSGPSGPSGGPSGARPGPAMGPAGE